MVSIVLDTRKQDPQVETGPTAHEVRDRTGAHLGLSHLKSFT